MLRSFPPQRADHAYRYLRQDGEQSDGHLSGKSEEVADFTNKYGKKMASSGYQFKLLVSDKKLNWADRKGDKPFGKSPKICNFVFATNKIQIYGQRYKFLRTAGTKSSNKIDGQAKN